MMSSSGEMQTRKYKYEDGHQIVWNVKITTLYSKQWRNISITKQAQKKVQMDGNWRRLKGISMWVFENLPGWTVLQINLVCLSILIITMCHENGAFEKTNVLQTGGIWKRRLCVLKWTENILKTELFENDDVTIITWFPWPRIPQTQIQNDRWLLRFQTSPT